MPHFSDCLTDAASCNHETQIEMIDFPDLSVVVGDDARVVALVGRGQLGDPEREGLVPGPVLRPRPRLQREAVLEPSDAGPRAALGRALQPHLQFRSEG